MNLLQKAEGQTDIWFLLLRNGTSLYEMWNFSSWFYFLCFVITSHSQVSSWQAEPSLPCKHSGSLQVHPVLCSRQTCVSCEANLIQHNWLKFGNSKRQSVAKCLQSGLNFFWFSTWWTCWCQTTSGAALWPGSPPRPPWPCPGSTAPLHRLGTQHGTPFTKFLMHSAFIQIVHRRGNLNMTLFKHHLWPQVLDTF